MNFKQETEKKTAYIEQILLSYLPQEAGYQKTVIAAMNYSMKAGGKRIRPLLMWETYKMFGGKGQIIEPFMAAIEMIHTYSLVHDDLPAMDNDEYRRGKKTTHIVYGEAMAILAGDALLNLAFETALSALIDVDVSDGIAEEKRTARALMVLAKRAGIYGMIGGQTADIEAEEKINETDEENLIFIHKHKTSALIQSAMSIGAILAGANEDEIIAMENCAMNIGLAFQIQDDILDITSSTEILGKPIGSDEKNKKITYVTLKGLEQSQNDVAKFSKDALTILNSFNNKNDYLTALVESLITREK
jgi:geranylgeranyl diphosphate synthase, type II